MSDTPLTDAMWDDKEVGPAFDRKIKNFCKSMEREIASLKGQVLPDVEKGLAQCMNCNTVHSIYGECPDN